MIVLLLCCFIACLSWLVWDIYQSFQEPPFQFSEETLKAIERNKEISTRLKESIEKLREKELE